MPTITVRLRHDCWHFDADTDQRTYIQAEPEDIDADALSPRARALAEAVSACGKGRLYIVLATTGPYTPPHTTPNKLAAAYGDALPPHMRASDSPVRKVVELTRMRADNRRSAVEYLEVKARELSREASTDWDVLGAAVSKAATPSATADLVPSPSAEAARNDVYLMRDEVLDRWRAAGQPMGIQAWDTLRQARHLPAPDRYVAGRIPQWLPETADAYLTRPREMWPISRIAEYLGLGGTPATAAGSARKQLFRWGLSATGRAPGRGGESMYDADQVIAAHENRAGSGWRRGTGKPVRQ